MADEPEVIAPVPDVDPPPTTPKPDGPKSPEELAAEPAEDEPEEEAIAAEPEDELEDLEWNGKQWKVPKGVKAGTMMQADYTKKTQAVSEKEKAVQAYEKRVQDQARANEEDLTQRAVFIGKAQELEKYKNVDWDAYIQQDPVAAQQAFTRKQALTEEVQGLANQIQQRQAQRSSEAQQAVAKRLNETREFAQKEIKGWTPELDQKIGSFARAQGIEDGELQAAMNPRIYKMLYLAYFGEQAINKPAVPKLVPAAPVPLTTVSAKGNAPVRKSLQDMSMDEYAAYRKRQEAAKRG